MTVLSALLMVTLTSGAPSTETLQQLFKQGDYLAVEAHALTRMGAVPSEPAGDVLYLLGLARFRLGKTAEALDALDAAGRAEVPPPQAPWQYNRAACLYKLGRLEEAETSFGEAAKDKDLRTVALIQAGFAALDAGAHERAQAWAERAKRESSEVERPLVDELLEALHPPVATSPEADAADGLYREGLSAYDHHQYVQARELFLAAGKKAPTRGRARLMAGAAAYQLGDVRDAWRDIQASRQLSLSPREDEIAQQYLDLLSLGLRGAGAGWTFNGVATSGYDSNVLQAGTAGRDLLRGESATPSASFWLDAFLGIVYRQKLSSRWFGALSYVGEQRAYLSAATEDYSLQQHRLMVSVESQLTDRWRSGGRATGDISLTGLSAFRGLQAVGTASAWVALDSNAWASTALELGYARKQGIGSEFDYLTGNRFDVMLSQTFRGWGGTELFGWYRFREDRIGELQQSSQASALPLCRGCTLDDVIPFSFRGHTLGVMARKRWGARLETVVEGSVEWRGYLDESYVLATPLFRPSLVLNRRRREDLRFTVSPEVGVALTRALSVSARWDLVVNRSNMDTRLPQTSGCTASDSACHRLDYGNQNYERHVISVSAELKW